MIHETISVRVEGSLESSHIKTYFIEDSVEFKKKKRPVIVLCPGGGYEFLSDREGEVLALTYNAMGCHAVVLYYSIAPATYPAALLEMAKTVKMSHDRADEWHIDTDKIILGGASAGGHLAASYGMFWKRDFIAKGIGLVSGDREVLRPNGMILMYPVITSGEYAHKGSFEKLLGNRYEEFVDEVSLEKQVNQDTPPAFIWHTFPDTCVPVENSLLLVAAMHKAGIPTEFHMYPKGAHGLSLGNEICESPNGNEICPCIESWTTLVKTWIYGL